MGGSGLASKVTMVLDIAVTVVQSIDNLSPAPPGTALLDPGDWRLRLQEARPIRSPRTAKRWSKARRGWSPQQSGPGVELRTKCDFTGETALWTGYLYFHTRVAVTLHPSPSSEGEECRDRGKTLLIEREFTSMAHAAAGAAFLHQ